MHFPLGRPILAMLLVACVSGAAVALHGRGPSAGTDLIVWTFTASQRDAFKKLIPAYTRATGRGVRVELLSTRAINVRLASMFMSGQRGAELPDLVELEIGQVGRFIKPPIDAIGLLPLESRLRPQRLGERFLQSRLAPYSLGGHQFGIPNDVHPVTITFREDLFQEAGIDLPAAGTWREFQDACLSFEAFWKARGAATRHAMELSESSSDALTMMLMQRGVNVVELDGRIRINDPIVAETVAFYAQLVAGERKISTDSASASGASSGLWVNDVVAGNVCAFFTPDWRVMALCDSAEQLSGKLRMMPLPRFEPTDAPTATWGGTMIGLPRDGANLDAAWQLARQLYLSDDSIRLREQAGVLAPLPNSWNDPTPADPTDAALFGGQPIRTLYIELARSAPQRVVNPVTPVALAELSVVMNRAVARVREHGIDGLEAFCQSWLDLAAADLRARVAHGRFE